MSNNQKETAVSESLNTQTNVEENPFNSDSYELLHRENIEGTPFQIIGNDEHGYFIAFGKYKLIPNEPTVIKARLQLQYQHWNIVLNLITILQEFLRLDILNETNTEKNI